MVVHLQCLAVICNAVNEFRIPIPTQSLEKNLEPWQSKHVKIAIIIILLDIKTKDRFKPNTASKQTSTQVASLASLASLPFLSNLSNFS